MAKACMLALTYNAKSDLDDFFSSIRRLREDGIGAEILELAVIDNNSTDGTYEELQKIQNELQFKLVRCKENLGYCGGNNVLLNDKEYIKNFEYIFITNVDVSFEPSLVKELLKLLDSDTTIGLACALELSYSTGAVRSCGSFWDYKKGVHGPILDVAKDVRDVDWCSGVFICLRREVVEKIGGLDEKIWMYCDDMDLGVRVKNAGYRVVVNPKATIRHKEKGRVSYFEVFYSTRNKLYVTKKHYPKYLFKAHLKHIRDILGNAIVRRDLKYGKHVMKGTFAYLRNQMGRVNWKD